MNLSNRFYQQNLAKKKNTRRQWKEEKEFLFCLKLGCNKIGLIKGGVGENASKMVTVIGTLPTKVSVGEPGGYGY